MRQVSYRQETYRAVLKVYLKEKKSQLFFYSFSGITSPAEIISFAASSTDISRIIISLLGTNNINPDVGFGVVGKKTVSRLWIGNNQ